MVGKTILIHFIVLALIQEGKPFSVEFKAWKSNVILLSTKFELRPVWSQWQMQIKDPIFIFLAVSLTSPLEKQFI